MASVLDLELEINIMLLKEIRWLHSYKNVADEALSYILGNVEDLDEHGIRLVVRALNVGAHENPRAKKENE